MIKNMEQCELDAVLTVADKMVTAAKTAPKASGQDSIVAAVVTGEDKERPYGLNRCALCGFENCAAMKKAGGVCAFNLSDLGIAVGSAVSLAADNRVDNRVMYSAGRGAVELGLLPDKIRVCYGIPLNATSKSIYFDRNPGAVLF